MSLAGQQCNGPIVNLWGLTIICRVRYVATDSILFSVGDFTNGAALFCHAARQLDGFSTGGGAAPFLQQPGSIIAGEWYWQAITIDLAGNVTYYTGKPRPFPRRASGKTAVYSKSLGTVANATGALGILGFAGGFSSAGAVRGMGVWTSALSLSQITAAMQPTINSGSNWGTGGLPATPWAFYDLTSDTDLTDNSGNGRPPFVPTGLVSTSTDYTPVPNPNTVALNIPCTGDSLTEGYTTTPTGVGYPAVLATLRPSDTVDNFGHDGATILTLTSLMTGDVFQSYDPTHGNVALVMIGVNDCVTGGISAATMLAQLIFLTNFLQAMGFNVIVTTILPYAGAFPGSATRTAYNALILGTSGVFDWVFDGGGNPYFVPTNHTIYQVDELHLVQATGYTHVATDNENPAIDDWLASFNALPPSSLLAAMM